MADTDATSDVESPNGDGDLTQDVPKQSEAKESSVDDTNENTDNLGKKAEDETVNASEDSKAADTNDTTAGDTEPPSSPSTTTQKPKLEIKLSKPTDKIKILLKPAGEYIGPMLLKTILLSTTPHYWLCYRFRGTVFNACTRVLIG